MEIKPIKTEKDYDAALVEIERLFGATPGTREADLLEVWTTLVEAYEEKHYSLPEPDPIEAIVYHMESRGVTRRDLEPLICPWAFCRIHSANLWRSRAVLLAG